MTVDALNTLPVAMAEQQFQACCGSSSWARRMTGLRPFQDKDSVYRIAGEVWWGLTPKDHREAFLHHPRIGEKGLREKFAATADWAMNEQAGVNSASEATLGSLARANEEYEKKFGTTFIVYATGKSADDMLAILRRRLNNDPETEWKEAAGEQAKITRIRLEKLLSAPEPTTSPESHHVQTSRS